jgi:hypothetical protein
MTILIASPTGTVAPHARLLAPAPAVLRGRLLAVLENGKPNARRLLTGVAQGLARRTGMQLTAVEAKLTAAAPCEAELLANLRMRAEVIITGSGD